MVLTRLLTKLCFFLAHEEPDSQNEFCKHTSSAASELFTKQSLVWDKVNLVEYLSKKHTDLQSEFRKYTSVVSNEIFTKQSLVWYKVTLVDYFC